MKDKKDDTTNSIVKAGLILFVFFFLGNEIVKQISRDSRNSSQDLLDAANKIGAATEEYNRTHPNRK